jgi:hypothetical protein
MSNIKLLFPDFPGVFTIRRNCNGALAVYAPAGDVACPPWEIELDRQKPPRPIAYHDRNEATIVPFPVICRLRP